MMKLRISPLVAKDLKTLKSILLKTMKMYKIGDEYVEVYRMVNRYQDITQIFI